ncbi:MAG: hypothetical protein HC924_17520 [Synechococcaceae cyanobacterium SM2_3_2]|nr:hypothetical protein [Synechococcaceae cyanobacterium SM2_3_2]
MGLYPGEFVPHIIFTFYPEEGPQKKAAEWAIPFPRVTDPTTYQTALIPPYTTGKRFRKRFFKNKASISVYAETEEEADRIGLFQDQLVDTDLLRMANDATFGRVGIRPGSKKKFESKRVYLKYVTAYLDGVNGACEGWDWSWRYDRNGNGSPRL